MTSGFLGGCSMTEPHRPGYPLYVNHSYLTIFQERGVSNLVLLSWLLLREPHRHPGAARQSE